MEVDSDQKKCESMESEVTVDRQTGLPDEQPPQQQPVCVIILGMAGSGKSSLCSKLVQHLFGKNTPPYVVNCDPACKNMDYLCNIDIRDTIHYKNVMEKYKLGPNGSIITSLNLFVTNFDQVLSLIEKRQQSHKFVNV